MKASQQLNIDATSDFEIVYAVPAQHTVALSAGWNLVSLPIVPRNDLREVVDANAVWRWDATVQRYVEEEFVNAETGYWIHADTAGAAADLSASKDLSEAVIASRLAAETYGLDILRSDIEDAEHNTTRFVVMAGEPADPDPESGPVMTTFVFRVRNVPAARYKAMGGFATNNVNMVKLESYMLDGTFNATQFYADIEGHPADEPVRLALEELGFFTRYVRVLGVYPANPFRST